MESFKFHELPDEMIDEIINRSEIRDIARLSGTSQAMRDLLTEETKERIALARELTQLKKSFTILAAKQVPFELSMISTGGELMVCAASDRFTAILGPSFPHDEDGQALITYRSIENWLKIYLILNNLVDTTVKITSKTQCLIDKTLASLIGDGSEEGKTISLNYLRAEISREYDGLEFLDELPRDLVAKAYYNGAYLSLVSDKLRTQINTKPYNISVRDLAIFLAQ